MRYSPSIFALLLLLLLAVPRAASASNASDCNAWCAARVNCDFCSTLRSCGDDARRIESFRGPGTNYYACESRAGASARNLAECQDWCDDRAACDFCSTDRDCGRGARRIESFKGYGQNYYACEDRSDAGERNFADCEEWCLQDPDCTYCSSEPGCGPDDQLRRFGGYGQNWYACGADDNRNAANNNTYFPALNAAAPNVSYAPDTTPASASDLSLNEPLCASRYQRWAWCGTSCWVVSNTQDKEILIIDGWTSKAAMGHDDYNLQGTGTLDRIVRLANFLRESRASGFKIVGWLVGHEHPDHAGDIGVLKWALQLPVGARLDDGDAGNDQSSVTLAFPPFSPDEASWIPIIADPDTVEHGGNAEGYEIRPHITHRLRFGTDAASRYSSSVSYAAGAALVREVDGVVEGCADCAGYSFRLGKFAVKPIIWDHKSPPVSVRRTSAFRIWHAFAPDARVVFISTSRGEDRSYFAGQAPITADHFIYAWANTSPAQDGDKADDAARVARDMLRTIPRPNSRSYVVSNHHDESMCEAGDCDIHDSFPDNLWDRLVEVEAVTGPASCRVWGKDGSTCVQLVELNHRLAVDGAWSAAVAHAPVTCGN